MLFLCCWRCSAGKIYHRTVCINTSTEQMDTLLDHFINSYFADTASRLPYRYVCPWVTRDIPEKLVTTHYFYTFTYLPLMKCIRLHSGTECCNQQALIKTIVQSFKFLNIFQLFHCSCWFKYRTKSDVSRTQ